MSKLIIINSDHRIAPNVNSTTNFTVNMSGGLSVGSIVVKSITIPNLMYNIRGNICNFTYNASGVPNTVTLPEGQYNFTELSTNLMALLNVALGVSTSITLNSITRKIIILTPGAPISLLSKASGNGMAEVLGILTDSPSDVETHNLTGLLNLFGVTNVLVHSSRLSQGYNSIISNSNKVGVICDFPISVPWGSIMHYESNDYRLNIKQYNSVQNINEIDIKLTDIDGEELNLHGASISVVLKVYPKVHIAHIL